MMNMLDTQDKLKNLSEQQLVGQMQSPTGNVPQFLVLGEIERRKRMRDDAQRQQGMNQTTVAQDAVAAAGVPQAGITDIAQALAPKTDMAQNTGIMSVAPQAEAPQMMAGGGVVKMAEGREVTGGPALNDPATIAMANRMGMTVSEYLSTLPAERVSAIQEDAARRQRQTAFQSDVFDPTRSVESQTGLQDGISFGQRKLDALAGAGANPTRDFGGASYYDREMPTLPTAAEIYAQDNPAPVRLPSVSDRLSTQPQRADRDRQELPAGPLTVENAATFENAMGASPAEGMGEFTAREPRTPRTVPPLTGPRAKSRAGIELPAYETTALENTIGNLFGAVGEKTGDLVGAIAGRTVEEQRVIDAARAEQERLDKLRGVASLTGATTLPAPAAAPVAAPVAAPAVAPVAAVAPQGIAALTGGTGTSGSGGTGGGAGGGGAASSYEQMLMDTLANREKAQKQDKWLALAQVGLGMMSSQNPSFFGAAGEAGLKGVESFRQSRDQYDNDRLKILGDLEQYKMAKAAAQARASGGGGGGGGFRRALQDQASILKLIDGYNTQAAEIRDAAAMSGGDKLEAEKRARGFEEQANALSAMLGIDAGNAGGATNLTLPTAIQP